MDPSYLKPRHAWFEGLEQSSHGKLILSNLLFDARSGRVDSDLIEQFLTDVDVELAAGEITQPACRVLTKIIDRPGKSYLCQSEPILTTTRRDYSRVVDAHDFLEYNTTYGSATHGLVRDDSRDNYLRRLFRRGLTGEVRGESRGLRPIAWVTTAEVVDEIRGDAGDDEGHLATTLRDRLGLAHVKDEARIVELTYPSAALTGHRLAPPSFLDAVDAQVYLSSDNSAHSGWGTTVDLTPDDDGISSCTEGLPEAVHPPLPLDGRFTLRDIGTVRGSRRIRAHEHERMLRLASEPWRGQCVCCDASGDPLTPAQ